MSLQICSLSSGSRGNCVFIESDKTRLLVDVGIGLSRLAMCLSVLKTDPTAIDGILVTHSHGDHINGITPFVLKYNKPIYVSSLNAATIMQSLPRVARENFVILEHSDFFLNDITVSPFEVSHDVPCVGYGFYCAGKKIAMATDLGAITSGVHDALFGSDLVLLESNHDESMVKKGRYPQFLKNRILSRHGHLSNNDCANALVNLVKGGTKQILLAHLSGENNTPAIAYSSVCEILAKSDLIAGKHYTVEVAHQDRMSSLYRFA